MPSLGAQVSYSAKIAHIARATGHDFLFIDVQHSLFGLETIGHIVQAALANGIAAVPGTDIIRIGMNDRPAAMGERGQYTDPDLADAVGLAQAAVIRRGEQYRTTQIDTGLPLAGAWTQASAPRWKAEPQGEGSLSKPAKIHPSGVASPTCSQPRDSPCTRKTSPRGAVRSTRALPSGPARRLAGLRTSTRGKDGAICAAAGGGVTGAGTGLGGAAGGGCGASTGGGAGCGRGAGALACAAGAGTGALALGCGRGSAPVRTGAISLPG